MIALSKSNKKQKVQHASLALYVKFQVLKEIKIYLQNLKKGFNSN